MADKKEITFSDAASSAEAQQTLARELARGRWYTRVDEGRSRGPVSGSTAHISAAAFMRGTTGETMTFSQERQGEGVVLRRVAAGSKKVEAPDSGAETPKRNRSRKATTTESSKAAGT